MRVENVNWSEADKAVKGGSLTRARKSAKVLADRVRQNCPVGTISRPMYRKGSYKNQPWTARDAGQLKRSVRVVERDEQKYGYMLQQYGNVRVYVGHYLAYYARIVEYSKPFMRPAVVSTMDQVKNILENG